MIARWLEVARDRFPLARSEEVSSRVRFLAPGGKLRAHLRGVGIFDLLSNDECLFGVLDGFSTLPEVIQYQTHPL